LEAPQGNCLCGYLNQAKMSFFSFTKISEQEGRTDTAWGWGSISGSEEKMGK
jgi:hypothetical protein